MNAVLVRATLLVVLALAAGCGQRGPLVLPESKQRPPAAGAPAVQPPAR